jgi:hypothetical protein
MKSWGRLRGFPCLIIVEYRAPGSADTICLLFIYLAQFDRLFKPGIAGHGIPAVTDKCVKGHDLESPLAFKGSGVTSCYSDVP